MNEADQSAVFSTPVCMAEYRQPSGISPVEPLASGHGPVTDSQLADCLRFESPFQDDLRTQLLELIPILSQGREQRTRS